LSGDYLIQGEFDLDSKHYTCVQKVAVRAAGLRAEMCWDTKGNTDVDLHVARLQGVTCATRAGTAPAIQDWGAASRTPTTRRPSHCLGYSTSAASACNGWGSKRPACATTPSGHRQHHLLADDRDPQATGFCSSENINLDVPKDGDRFVVGVNYFTGTTVVHPHVNIYCNGQRVLSSGYNPVAGQNAFPAFRSAGRDDSGDFWTVATVTAHVQSGTLTTCDVAPVSARTADPASDGAAGSKTAYCVDSAFSAAKFDYTSHAFINAGSGQTGTPGGVPASVDQWCKH